MRLRIHPRRQQEGTFDDRINAVTEAAIEKLDRAGKWNDETFEELTDRFSEAIHEPASRIVDTWMQHWRTHRRKTARYGRAFARRLAKDYGAGLDRMHAFIDVSIGTGADYGPSERAKSRDAYTLHALLGLHARGCLVALEVHTLLSNGFPQAALARARTLHEISVVALLLSEHELSHPDLAERYVLHEKVLNLSDANSFQEYADELGYVRFDDELMKALKTDRDELVERFGTPYKKVFGWASDLIGNKDPKFDQLEKLAERAHLRGHYKWASREVHADSKGLRLNTIVRGDQRSQLVGKTNLGLVEPATLAVGALQNVTVSLVLDPENASPSTSVVCAALNYMVPTIAEELRKGHDAVTDREAKLQQRITDGKSSLRDRWEGRR